MNIDTRCSLRWPCVADTPCVIEEKRGKRQDDIEQSRPEHSDRRIAPYQPRTGFEYFDLHLFCVQICYFHFAIVLALILIPFLALAHNLLSFSLFNLMFCKPVKNTKFMSMIFASRCELPFKARSYQYFKLNSVASPQ